MKNYFYIFFTFILLINCSEKKSEPQKLSVSELAQTTEFAEASPEKRQLFNEIQAFQKDLQSKKSENISNNLDCPKRIEELDLKPKNSVVRNDIESNSFRLSSTLVTNNYDLVYNELDLNIINDAIKSISETDLLSKDNVSTTVKVGECDYQTDIMMKNKEVDFNIKSITENEECKKDQKWKFISTDGILVLDHRKML